MANLPYLERMNQLKGEKAESVAQKAASLGLPTARPGMPAGEKQMLGVPPQEQEDPMAKMMDSQFGRNLQGFMDTDARFGEMFQEYSKMAMGLKQQVDSGYMPKVIAERKLQQYVQDSGKYFDQNAIKPTDNPEIRGMLEGIMSQGAGQGAMPPQDPSQMPPQQPMGGMQ